MIPQCFRALRKVVVRFIFPAVLFPLLIGCNPAIFGHTYHEGVLKNQVLQNARVAEAAKQSSDVFSFASVIYSSSAKARGDDFIVLDDGFSDRSYGDMSSYIDTAVLKIYCTEKGGELFKWSVQGDYHAYSGFQGISKSFFACEIGKKVSAVLIYEDFGRGQDYLGPMPYRQKMTLGTEKYFSSLIKEYKLEGFVSKNGMVTIPSAKITDAKTHKAPISGIQTFLFSFRNDTQEPVEINMLNSHVMLKGATLPIDFTFRDEPIFWQDYNNLFQGCFIGEGNKYMSSLRFNPGQKFSGQVLYSITGLPKLTEDDIAGLTLVLDGNICKDFQKISFYDLQKTKL